MSTFDPVDSFFFNSTGVMTSFNPVFFQIEMSDHKKIRKITLRI